MKVVAIVSGGMDSSTLLYKLLADGHDVTALSFDYGQRHKVELQSARKVCDAAGVKHEVVDLSSLQGLLAGSSLTSKEIEVPEGHYEDETMKATVVPNRNMIMLSIAIGNALSLKADAVAYGAHSGDHAIYPDCRPEFVAALQTAALLCDWKGIAILRPLIGLDKGDIAKLGVDLGVPFEDTWTCYKGEDVHCGKCGACQERIEAFAKFGLTDPVKFAVGAVA